MRKFRLIMVGLGLAFLLVPMSDARAADGLGGRILLDVERHGEAWYVHPASGKRYRLGSPAEALATFQKLSLGIAAANLSRIPEDGADAVLPPDLAPHVRGRFLLDVEGRGALWYVDPGAGTRVAIGSAEAAYGLLRSRGLGIASSHLDRLPKALFTSRAVRYGVPFTPQAPLAEWWDRRQREGCEEASVLMAVRWARGEPLSLVEARSVIRDASAFEAVRLGHYEDTSIDDTAQVLFREHFGFDDIEVRKDIGAADIAAVLDQGKIAVVGVDGRRLGNPYFSPPGPVQHMVTVVGYDPSDDAFLVHDPGTRRGAFFRYPAERLQQALLDYPSGYREPILHRTTGMIVVTRPVR